jgi:tetratricopeptide (TPR) repeat protein
VQTIQVRVSLALSVVLCAAGPAKPFTNSDQEMSVVKGEIESSRPNISGYTVQLYDISRHSTTSTSEIRSDGEFEFLQMPYGSYLVTVTNARGESVYQGNFNVGQPAPFIIRLPKEETARPGAGTISVKQLQHPPARKAYDALLAAQKFAETGDYNKAVESIERAIAISPDYADAWVNLGARHIGMGRYRQAIAETRHAIELAGPSPMTLSNIAFAQALLGNRDEARQSAEEALRLKPDDAHANYIFGLILYMSHAPDGEALRHLQLAAPTITGARDLLAKIQGNSGHAPAP